MFLQKHEAGRFALSDFTELKGIQVTVGGQPFEHLLYHFRMAFSGWLYAQVITGGDSFSALSSGLQNALWRLGGVMQEHRTDSLAAAYKNLAQHEQDDMTARYEALAKHYGFHCSRNNKGKSHENGAIEGPHGHLKQRIEQALILRGSHDFPSITAYQQWINKIVLEINQSIAPERLSAERAGMCKVVSVNLENRSV